MAIFFKKHSVFVVVMLIATTACALVYQPLIRSMADPNPPRSDFQIKESLERLIEKYHPTFEGFVKYVQGGCEKCKKANEGSVVWDFLIRNFGGVDPKEATYLERFFDKQSTEEYTKKDNLKNNAKLMVLFGHVVDELNEHKKSIKEDRFKQILHKANLITLNLHPDLTVEQLGYKTKEKKEGVHSISDEDYFAATPAALFVYHLYKKGAFNKR